MDTDANLNGVHGWINTQSHCDTINNCYYSSNTEYRAKDHKEVEEDEEGKKTALQSSPCCPLKILFLDGRVATSMSSQLLPRIEKGGEHRKDEGWYNWHTRKWQCIVALRSMATSVIEV